MSMHPRMKHITNLCRRSIELVLLIPKELFDNPERIPEFTESLEYLREDSELEMIKGYNTDDMGEYVVLSLRVKQQNREEFFND